MRNRGLIEILSHITGHRLKVGYRWQTKCLYTTVCDFGLVALQSIVSHPKSNAAFGNRSVPALIRKVERRV